MQLGKILVKERILVRVFLKYAEESFFFFLSPSPLLPPSFSLAENLRSPCKNYRERARCFSFIARSHAYASLIPHRSSIDGIPLDMFNATQSAPSLAQRLPLARALALSAFGEVPPPRDPAQCTSAQRKVASHPAGVNISTRALRALLRLTRVRIIGGTRQRAKANVDIVTDGPARVCPSTGAEDQTTNGRRDRSVALRNLYSNVGSDRGPTRIRRLHKCG